MSRKYKMKYVEKLILCKILLLGFTHYVDLMEIRVESKDKREPCPDEINSASSNIALEAAEEAKEAASAQFIAGNLAAHRVREQLADKAMEAAKSAQTAATAKAALVDEISKEREAVKMVIVELMNSKRRIEQAIESQLRALQEENSALKVLMAAMHVAESTSSNADSTLRDIQDDLIDKKRVLESALRRTNALNRKEEYARRDVESTKSATRKAVMAASEARVNAMRI